MKTARQKMLLIRTIFACCVCLIFLFNHVEAQGIEKRFRNISVEKGLSQSTVFSVAQDRLGFMWLGTQDGLNRYDGRSFTVYRPVKTNTTSISSFYIRSLFNDKEGRMWVGGNGGINAYNYLTNSFEKFNITPGPGEWYVSSIVQDSEGKIWASTNSGEVYRSDIKRKQFTKIITSASSGLKEIYSLTFWGKDLLLGSNKGLFLFYTDKNTVSPVNVGIATSRINCFFKDQNSIWIGSEGEGLVKLDTRSGAFKNFRHEAGTATSIANNSVRSVEKDAQGHLWIGTFTGLSILKGDNEFLNYYHDPKDNFSIAQNSVRCIYRDKQNGMWLGTFYGGVSYYHNQLISFATLNQNSEAAPLNDNVVNVIKQDDRQNFWIGTESGGLNYWIPGEKKIRYFVSRESPTGLSSNNIKSIAFADDGSILLGTHNAGLNVFNPATGANNIFKYNPANPNSISGNMVYSLLKDQSGRIWVGTRTGLNLFDINSHTFTAVNEDSSGKRISSREITYLMEDSKGRVWIGTINGVNILEADKFVFKSISNKTLSNVVVNFIAEDKKGRIWIGTRDGLNLFDEKTKTFISYNDRTDLLNGNINSILSDTEGNLWIATNTNLVKYNADEKSVIRFDGQDGLQNNQFNVYASCMAQDGKLLFGGLNGISFFYPRDLNQKPQPLRLSFTGLEVFGKLITPGDTTNILSKYINEINTIHLANEYRQFTILFNTFNYISDNRTKYIYKLDGFDKGWQQADALPRASYTNLQAGSYTFHVKAIGPQGEESPERTLTIIVKPVWYRSSWFYFAAIVFVIIASIFLYRLLTERMRALHQLKLERVQREQANYINKIKMDFFTNVSHELRTPLTLIMAPLEEILKQPETDKKMRRHHELMMRNTRRLYHIVNQLFEFKKTEMGTRKLRVGKNDLISFAREVYQSFIPMSEKNQIIYKYSSSVEELCFLFDKDAVENILFNLLSNAFKYTSIGQEVALTVETNGEQAIITVTDTGKGIKEEHLSKIFERFYQVNGVETNLGSGVGLAFTRRLVELHHGYIDVKSKPGAGSIFIVYLPIADNLYHTDMRTDDMIQPINEEPHAATSSVDDEIEEIDERTGDEVRSSLESILVVDDNTEIADYIYEYFKKNYNVVIAHNGKEALAKLENLQPDLIISDIMMPEMDGLHFCKRIKQNIQTSHIPVLLLTAKSETSQQLRGYEMGADDYVTKPFSISLLEAKVKSILRVRARLKLHYAAGEIAAPEELTFNSLDEDFLKKTISFIEANIDEYDLSVEKLSKELAMSRSNLYLKLKAITGESVTTLIKRTRLKKAVELIKEQKYTISEIAYMCGFNTPSYFSTAFKQFYGCMPSEYLNTFVNRKLF